MNKFVKKQLFITIITVIVLVLVITLSLIRTKFDVTSPGITTDTSKLFYVDNASSNKGSFNTVSVLSYTKSSLLHYLIGLMDEYTDIDQTSEVFTYTDNELYTVGQIQKDVSIINSAIAAYTFCQRYDEFITIKTEYTGYIITTIANYLTENTLHFGDIITHIDNIPLNGNNLTDLIRGKTQIDVTIRGKANPVTIYGDIKDGYVRYGFYGYNYYSFEDSTPSLSYRESTTLGPSGGLLQALEIANQLLPFDLTRGKKIVGTGTIEANGAVGEIGGIYQKIITSYFNNADLFIIPVIRKNSKLNLEISNLNTLIIDEIDTLHAINSDNIPYIYQGYWYIGDYNTNIYAYGNLDESDPESNYEVALKALDVIDNKLPYICASSLDEAINLLIGDNKELAYHYFNAVVLGLLDEDSL